MLVACNALVIDINVGLRSMVHYKLYGIHNGLCSGSVASLLEISIVGL